MDKKFVKLGDKYYYVEANEQGLQLVPATDNNVMDEVLEQAVLIDPAENAGDNFLQTIIDQTKYEMIDNLKRGLKSTVLGCLGFSKSSWANEYEVDHCNGRMSEVTNHISVTMKQILKDATIEDLGITEAERNKLMAAYKKDLLDSYKNKMRQELWRTVDALAKQDAAKVAESLLKERQVEVGKMVLERLLKK